MGSKTNGSGNALPEGATPVPVKLTVWLIVRIAPAPSDRVSVADLPSNPLGVNVTSIVQVLVPPTNDAGSNTLLVQLFVPITKSVALVPVIAALLKVSGPIPVLVNVTVWAALASPICIFPNARELGNALPDGATPTPVKLTNCVCNTAPVASLTIIFANRLPTEPGVNVTAIVQLAPAARLVVQVLAGD